jgi:2,3-bisphosphoglycerate-independent phosphoglycerate mutase
MISWLTEWEGNAFSNRENMETPLYQRLIAPAQTRIVMIIMDGLGGLAREPGGKTELESAKKPNLDSLAFQSALGLSIPVAPGITPGSGPGHLALFGYDPIHYEIGRGALEALGVDFEMGPDDVAARGNFCTIDSKGRITDRRAGRISSAESSQLVELLQTIKVEGVEFFVRLVKEHRFAFVMRGPGLGEDLSDTDPQATNVPPLEVTPQASGSRKTAQFANRFVEEARKLLVNKMPANMVILRGFAKLPKLPSFTRQYGLHAAAIAINGMYRGVAKMAGMEILDVGGDTLADEFATLEKHWHEFDFFYLHVKKTDTAGESGDFEGKVKAIEEMDSYIPRVMKLNPDVVIVGGDHSSPAVMKFHSWHPVPMLLYATHVRSDNIHEFGEHACARGNLGIFPATNLMPLALANAGRISKYGA